MPQTRVEWAEWLRAASRLPGRAARPPALAQVWEQLTWVARREGFAVEREYCGGGDGVTMWARRVIRVAPTLDGSAAVVALAHELGHVVLHRPAECPPGASTAGCRGVAHVEAVSVAQVVCARLGVDTSAFRFPHVASWAGSDPRARPGAARNAVTGRVLGAAG